MKYLEEYGISSAHCKGRHYDHSKHRSFQDANYRAFKYNLDYFATDFCYNQSCID